MSRLTAGVCLWACMALTASAADRAAVIVVPGEKGATRLGVEVVLDGRSPALAWEGFLDSLFAYADRDGDGFLSREEARRTVPLPLPGRNELLVDFGELDADRDGKGSRGEWKSFCRAGGFGPVAVVVEAPSAADRRLAGLLYRCLDADGNGTITGAELRRAPQALRKLDLDEDEYLDLTELLAAPPSDEQPREVPLKLGEGGEADVVIRLDVGAKAPTAGVEGKHADRVRLVRATAPQGLHRLHGPADSWKATLQAVRVAPDVGTAAEFLTSQFKTSLGDQASLRRDEVENDPMLGGLLELFRYADRNGDDRLSIAELEAYLELVERGVGGQVWIKVTDRGRNPFPFLDADGDGRLSYQELAGADAVLAAGGVGLTEFPRQLEFSFGGPSVPSWGGVPLPAGSGRPRPAKGIKGPPWFGAMDRNGDGIISPREFVGPPEVFRKLDGDGDGVISVDEATAAEGR